MPHFPAHDGHVHLPAFRANIFRLFAISPTTLNRTLSIFTIKNMTLRLIAACYFNKHLLYAVAASYHLHRSVFEVLTWVATADLCTSKMLRANQHKMHHYVVNNR